MMPERNICNLTTPGHEKLLENYLIKNDVDMFGIYQLKHGEQTRDYLFERLDRIRARGMSVDRANYKPVYVAPLRAGETLGSIYETFNINRPADFTGHSLSVSDIVVLQKRGEATAYYVDDIGFKPIPGFIKAAAKRKEHIIHVKQDTLAGV